MSTYHLEVITPERVFFSGEVESLVVSTSEGKLGILKGHVPMVAGLKAGSLEMKAEGAWKTAACSEGFVTIWEDGVSVMAHSVLWPEEIDRVRAEEAKQRAEEMIRQAKSVQEYVHFKASIARAVARLQVTNNHNVNMD